MKKKTFAIFAFTLVCAISCTVFAVGCSGDKPTPTPSETTVVAQGVVDDAHGIPVHFLYQELSDGKVGIYRLQGGGSYKAQPIAYDYAGNIVKSKDKDGDVEVKMTITGFTLDTLGEDLTAMGGPDYADGKVTTYEKAEERTTYLQDGNAVYVYDIVIPWEISGEHKNTTVSVKPVSDSNKVIDVDKWKSDYKAAILKENAGGGSQGEESTDKPVANFFGTAADTVTGASVELNGDYTVKATVGYASGGSIRMNYFTQTGVWNIVNGKIAILMNKQQNKENSAEDVKNISKTYMLEAETESKKYSFTFSAVRSGKYNTNDGTDETFTIPVSFDFGESSLPATDSDCVTFFGSAKANDHGDNGITLALSEGGLVTAYSGFVSGGAYRAYYSVECGTWSLADGVYTVKIGEATYTSTSENGTFTLASVAMGDVTLNLTYTPGK